MTYTNRYIFTKQKQRLKNSGLRVKWFQKKNETSKIIIIDSEKAVLKIA